MPRMNLNLPYDEEIFNYQWKTTPDLILTTMLSSGAVVHDTEIQNLISNGSNFFSTPYYNEIGGDEDVYNGTTDFNSTSVTGGHYSGVVYGRMKKWDAVSFINDFNSGADPMAQIVNGVATYWNRKRQERLIKIVEAIFGITDTDMADHKTNLASATTTATEDNLIGPTSLNDMAVKACGDNAHVFRLAIMHSTVANRLANLQLLEFSKYTDASGITRNLPIGVVNGYTVIVNDNVPVKASTVASSTLKEYTTYLFGEGAIRYAQAPVEKPSEMDRDPNKNGGTDMIYTRMRECFQPQGFSFKGDYTTDVGIPDTVLTVSASWERKMPAKSVAMARLITNG